MVRFGFCSLSADSWFPLFDLCVLCSSALKVLGLVFGCGSVLLFVKFSSFREDFLWFPLYSVFVRNLLCALRLFSALPVPRNRVFSRKLPLSLHDTPFAFPLWQFWQSAIQFCLLLCIVSASKSCFFSQIFQCCMMRLCLSIMAILAILAIRDSVLVAALLLCVSVVGVGFSIHNFNF